MSTITLPNFKNFIKLSLSLIFVTFSFVGISNAQSDSLALEGALEVETLYQIVEQSDATYLVEECTISEGQTECTPIQSLTREQAQDLESKLSKRLRNKRIAIGAVASVIVIGLVLTGVGAFVLTTPAFAAPFIAGAYFAGAATLGAIGTGGYFGVQAMYSQNLDDFSKNYIQQRNNVEHWGTPIVLPAEVLEMLINKYEDNFSPIPTLGHDNT